MSKIILLLAALFIGSLGLTQPISAQQGRANREAARSGTRIQRVIADSEAALAERMNANTVAGISGTPGGTYFRAASDMAFVLDDGDNLRILPILGKGAGQNAYDIRFLRGIDLGLCERIRWTS